MIDGMKKKTIINRRTLLCDLKVTGSPTMDFRPNLFA